MANAERKCKDKNKRVLDRIKICVGQKSKVNKIPKVKQTPLNLVTTVKRQPVYYHAV